MTQEPTRDYLKEALDIALGKSMLLPEKDHIRALLRQIVLLRLLDDHNRNVKS